MAKTTKDSARSGTPSSRRERSADTGATRSSAEIQFSNEKGTLISIVHDRRRVSHDSKYYILWKDIPTLLKLVKRKGGKVTPSLAKDLIKAGLLRKVV